MATLVGIDGAASVGNTGTGTSTSWTFSHTTGAGSNKLLLVAVSQFSDGTNLAVTWDGSGSPVSLTHLVTCGGTGTKVSFFYLLAPTASATGNVAITCTNARRMAAWAQSFTNVLQSGPFRTPIETSGSGTASALTVTDAIASDLVVNALAKRDSTNDPGTDVPAEDGAGEWTDRSVSTSPSFNVWTGGQSEDGSASVAFNWTWGVARVHGSVACAMVAVPAGSRRLREPTMLGGVIGDYAGGMRG